jgi:hypothetical protein
MRAKSRAAATPGVAAHTRPASSVAAPVATVHPPRALMLEFTV